MFAPQNALTAVVARPTLKFQISDLLSPFRMNTYENCACNPSRMNTCKIIGLKVVQNEHLQKRGRGVPTRTTSEEIHRVHIQQHRALGNSLLRTECLAAFEHAVQRRPTRRLEQKLEPVLELQPRQWRRRRTQHTHAARFHRLEIRPELPRPANGLLEMHAAHQQSGQRRKWRVMHEPAKMKLLLEKRCVVLPRRKL